MHRRKADVGALIFRREDAGEYAVGPVLVLTQIHIDARHEVPAEDAVHEFERKSIGTVLQGGELGGNDQTLTRAGTIDEIDFVFGRLRNFRDGFPGNVAGFPGAEKGFEFGGNLRESGVADDEQGGVVGFEIFAMEFGEILAG